MRSYRDTEEDGCFSCCAFSVCFRTCLNVVLISLLLLLLFFGSQCNKVCDFHVLLQACEKYLILGTYAGEIKYYDLMSGEV
jgi:hypothetical protein